LSSSISNLAILYMDVGETAHARKLLEETMELDQERGDEWGVAVTSLNLVFARLELEEGASGFVLCPVRGGCAERPVAAW
jgi:hypothetical protein